MNNIDLKLRLLAGDPIEVDMVKIYPVTLKDVKNIGLNTYNRYLSILTLDKSSLEIDDDEVKNFHLLFALSVKDDDFKEVFNQASKLFFKNEIDLLSDGTIKLGSSDIFLTENNFDEIQKVIKLQNWIKESEKEDYNPANERARKFIEEIKKLKQKYQQKSNLDLHSIISGMSWKPNNGVNLFNIWDLTIYQLYDGYYRLENIDNYNNTIRGIYSGTIDSKKINFKDLNWAKILNL